MKGWYPAWVMCQAMPQSNVAATSKRMQRPTAMLSKCYVVNGLKVPVSSEAKPN
eukprot:m.240757 g.240757  ORF g.240757 m.240757 type:complete len:54 (+) comp15313_c0_seq12:979-1140(+)